MKIYIPDDYQNVIKSLDCYRILEHHEVKVFNDTVTDENELVNRFRDADCIVLTRERTKLSRNVLEKLSKLKLISQTGKVASHLDVEACTELGIAVAEGKGSPAATAELTWLLIMASLRKLVPAVNALKEGKWQTNIGDCLQGKTLGIWGYGKIGRKIASFGNVFGMKIIVWGSEGSRNAAVNDGFISAESREKFFRECDVVSIHLRLKPETRGIIKYEDLVKMKPDSLFVNTSRAGLLEPEALKRALAGGRPGRAAMDVYENEPIFDKSYWAFNDENVLCTPHLGYVEKSGYEYYFGTAFSNAVKFFEGQPENILNPEVLDKSK